MQNLGFVSVMKIETLGRGKEVRGENPEPHDKREPQVKNCLDQTGLG